MTCQKIIAKLQKILKLGREVFDLMSQNRIAEAHQLYLMIKKLTNEISPDIEKFKKIDSVDITKVYGRSMGWGASLVTADEQVIVYDVINKWPGQREDEPVKNIIFSVTSEDKFSGRIELQLQDFSDPKTCDLIFGADYIGDHHLAIAGASQRLLIVGLEDGETLSETTQRFNGEDLSTTSFDDWIFTVREKTIFCFKTNQTGLINNDIYAAPNLEIPIESDKPSNVIKLHNGQYFCLLSEKNTISSGEEYYRVFGIKIDPKTRNTFPTSDFPSTNKPIKDIVRVGKKIYGSNGDHIVCLESGPSVVDLNFIAPEGLNFTKMLSLPGDKLAVGLTNGDIMIYNLKNYLKVKKLAPIIKRLNSNNGRVIGLNYLNGYLYSSHQDGIVNKWGVG